MAKTSTNTKPIKKPLNERAFATSVLIGMTLSFIIFLAGATLLSPTTSISHTLPRMWVEAAILLFLLVTAFFLSIATHLSKHTRMMIGVWAVWAAISTGQYLLGLSGIEFSIFSGFLAEAIVVALYLSLLKHRSHHV
jgi:lysylphosphatidylglycerol synthetase-like protein (DUF2156 family)